jgi:FxsC-like protein
MPYDFFFSYTRADNDAYLRKFFADLNEAVRRKAGYPQGTLTGFFDQKRLEAGTEWNPALVTALQESSTLVCVYSPAYFKSEFCGREWGLFEERWKLYKAQRLEAVPGAAQSPSVIKPVLWIPLRETLPAGIGNKQFTSGNPQSALNTVGLLNIRMRYSKYKNEYLDFVDLLSDEILTAQQSYKGVLPRVIPEPDFQTARNAFKVSPVPGQAAAPKPQDQGPNGVQFVFVAGKPNEFQGNRSIGGYLQKGGRDWKPYYPQKTKPIGALAQSVAASEDLDFFSEELPFSKRLPQEVRDAEKQANIVVLVVDSWTVTLPDYNQILQQFDEEGYFNCSVLIPWNDADIETAQQRAALEAQVRSVFRRQSRLPLYFRDSITSEEELKAQLRDVLIRLKAEVFNQAPVSRPVPRGGTKPVVEGPGGKDLQDGEAA